KQFSHLFCSSVLSLAELILTALAADLVLFNSRHNMDTFLHGIDSFLNAMPDYRTRGLGTGIAAKSQILYLPIVPLASLADGQLEPKRSRISAQKQDLDAQHKSVAMPQRLHQPPQMSAQTSWPERPDNFTGDDFLEDLKRNLYVKPASLLTVVVATESSVSTFLQSVLAYCLMLQGHSGSGDDGLFGLGMLRSAVPGLSVLRLAALTNPICHLCELVIYDALETWTLNAKTT
uniref:tRNA-queuosine alpha-mannosyltransferase n=1 Tax=Macrostomum lignano TaxID=282301 RepID=A0A1I8JNF6_9PLAT